MSSKKKTRTTKQKLQPGFSPRPMATSLAATGSYSPSPSLAPSPTSPSGSPRLLATAPKKPRR